MVRPACWKHLQRSALRLRSKGRETNEHLDNLVRSAAYSVDWRLHCIPRRRSPDPPVARPRGDFAHPAFCDGETGSLTSQALTFGLDDRAARVSFPLVRQVIVPAR